MQPYTLLSDRYAVLRAAKHGRKFMGGTDGLDRLTTFDWAATRRERLSLLLPKAKLFVFKPENSEKPLEDT